jgi:hypothetical protein
MSDQTKPGAHGALAEAAERFDRLARVVKDQQLSETRSGPRVALSDTYVASPEEAWAKKFMTQAIGPASGTVVAPTLPAFTPAVQLSQPMHGYAAAPAQQAPTRPHMGAAAPGDLRRTAVASQRLQAQERRRRTWLGWLLLGR